jgi:hypothetical protein
MVATSGTGGYLQRSNIFDGNYNFIEKRRKEREGKSRLNEKSG